MRSRQAQLPDGFLDALDDASHDAATNFPDFLACMVYSSFD